MSRPIAHFDGTSCGVLTFVAPRVSLSPALSRFVSVTDAALRDSANAVLFYFFYFFILCRSRGREGPWFAASSVLYDPSVSGGRPRPRLPQICLQGSTPQHAQLLLGCWIPWIYDSVDECPFFGCHFARSRFRIRHSYTTVFHLINFIFSISKISKIFIFQIRETGTGRFIWRFRQRQRHGRTPTTATAPLHNDRCVLQWVTQHPLRFSFSRNKNIFVVCLDIAVRERVKDGAIRMEAIKKCFISTFNFLFFADGDVRLHEKTKKNAQSPCVCCLRAMTVGCYLFIYLFIYLFDWQVAEGVRDSRCTRTHRQNRDDWIPVGTRPVVPVHRIVRRIRAALKQWLLLAPCLFQPMAIIGTTGDQYQLKWRPYSNNSNDYIIQFRRKDAHQTLTDDSKLNTKTFITTEAVRLQPRLLSLLTGVKWLVGYPRGLTVLTFFINNSSKGRIMIIGHRKRTTPNKCVKANLQCCVIISNNRAILPKYHAMLKKAPSGLTSKRRPLPSGNRLRRCWRKFCPIRRRIYLKMAARKKRITDCTARITRRIKWPISNGRQVPGFFAFSRKRSIHPNHQNTESIRFINFFFFFFSKVKFNKIFWLTHRGKSQWSDYSNGNSGCFSRLWRGKVEEEVVAQGAVNEVHPLTEWNVNHQYLRPSFQFKVSQLTNNQFCTPFFGIWFRLGLAYLTHLTFTLTHGLD